MPTHTIFYSWQSDSPNSTNRGFIEDCLERAIKELKRDDLGIDPTIDRDRRDVPGTPDIPATILAKIRAADVFVADVTIINPRGPDPTSSRPTPNPNVLIELGYAAAVLDWRKVVCVFNARSGRVEELPFDIRHRGLVTYSLAEGEDKADARKFLTRRLSDEIRAILNAPDPEAVAARRAFYSQLMVPVRTLVIYGSEFEQRFLFGQVNTAASVFAVAAGRLRDLAATRAATDEGLGLDLTRIADLADTIGHFQLHSGNGDELRGLVRDATAQAGRLKAERLDTMTLPADDLRALLDRLRETQAKVTDLGRRFEAGMRTRPVKPFLVEAAGLGLTICECAAYNLDGLAPGLSAPLSEIGHRLHLMDANRLTFEADLAGWASAISQAGDDMQQLLATVRQP
jgi:hypothetical protein